jgi:hypothetical protein
MESWKDVKGYENIYKVSNFGNVKSLIKKEKILKPYLTGKKKRQYKTFRLYKNKKHKQFKASQLVAMSFLNHKPNGYESVVDHIDNNPFNDNLINLQIISARDNIIKNMDRGVSEFLGVTFNKNAGKYRAYYKYNNRQVHLGYFISEIEASKAYKNFIKDKLV